MKTIITLFISVFVVSFVYSQETAHDIFKQGNEQEAKKNYKEALELYNKAIVVDSSFGEAWASRGMVKYYLKDFIGAIDDFNQAVKLIPNYAEVYDLRGISKYELGDKTGACEDWNIAYDSGFKNAYDLIKQFCMDEKK